MENVKWKEMEERKREGKGVKRGQGREEMERKQGKREAKVGEERGSCGGKGQTWAPTFLQFLSR